MAAQSDPVLRTRTMTCSLSSPYAPRHTCRTGASTDTCAPETGDGTWVLAGTGVADDAAADGVVVADGVMVAESSPAGDGLDVVAPPAPAAAVGCQRQPPASTGMLSSLDLVVSVGPRGKASSGSGCRHSGQR